MADSFEVDVEQIAATVLSNSEITGVRLSALAMRLFAEAARLLRYKKSEQDQLSSTTYTLAAYLYGRRLQYETASDEQRALKKAIQDLNSEVLDEIAESFFTSVPDVPGDSSDYPTADDLGDVVLGIGTRALIAGRPSGELLNADVLLRMLLDNPSTGVYRRVHEEQGRSVEQPGDAPGQEVEPPNLEDRSGSGRHVKIVREATLEELGLNALDYAKALATILRVSEGEFNFALFGKWGSGKTTLLRLLKPLLEDSSEYRKNVSVPRTERYADREYKVVVHNAWKYRKPPESWIFLYKSLAAAAASSAGPLERWTLALRSNSGRHGRGGLLISLVLLAIALAPMEAKLQLASLLVSALGLSTVFYLVMITTSTHKKVKQLFDRNLRLVGPEENLGMLALIGDDVRALLKAWTKEPSAAKQRQEYPIWPLFGLAVVSLLWATSLCLGSIFELPDSIKDVVTKIWPRENGPHLIDFTHWMVWALWTVCGVSLLLLPYIANSRRPDRILLVIDDLDRCEASEMLSVIENVRLLLDDQDINERMQVLMLVDEGVLNHAVALRYETMITERAKSSDYQGATDPHSAASAEIVAEQIEKLFACHLRLSRLSDDDVVQLVRKLAGHENAQRKLKEQRERRRAAKADLDKAMLEEKYENEQYNAMAWGRPLPGRQQRPMQSRLRVWIDHVTTTGTAKRRAEKENEPIDDSSRRIAGMSEEQRMARHPDDRAALTRTRAQTSEMRRIYDSLPAESDSVTVNAFEAPFEANDVRFSDAEVEILSGFMPSYFRTLSRRPSPRSIKALLFKLQLARLLMQLRFPNHSTEQFDKLLQAFQQEALGASADNGPHALIVRQVI
ncbi:P-loop NTPase fold protein [Bradyrhizobium sp. USDA 3650]